MNDRPRTASSVWLEMPFMRGPKAAERLREIVPVLKDNRAQAVARRERVLAHPWARKKLCDIFQLARAEQWNGYVPPAHDPDGQVNDSPLRKALIDLLREVEQFEQNNGEEQA